MRSSLFFAAALLCLGASATVAQSGPPLSADEFDAYATGKTLTYAESGQIFGTEQYLTNRRVRWAFTDDVCKIGHWYPQDDLICFVYEDERNPQCWEFWREGNGLRARFNGDPAGTELSEVQQTSAPMPCYGPDVGA
ncbi:hypothetical protein [Gemmobacter serpentinus]|uniref:hypothetical protein n=1 Tax=Gemmobacter serpentinus TaxID=2652247 RepID=UPI00124F5CBB|nr:hypothetical protein [Gemmobacter serpentinus]